MRALDLPVGTKLERRSWLVRLPASLHNALARIDRVYQADGRPESATPAGSREAASPATGQVPSAPTMEALAADRSFLWENAVMADEVMVRVESTVSQEQLADALPKGFTVQKQVLRNGLYLVGIPTSDRANVEQALDAMQRLRGVVHSAEPDGMMTAMGNWNDPNLTDQWHLAKTNTLLAWDVIEKSGIIGTTAKPVVAVLDTGVDLTHPDLAANIWQNPGESGGGKESNHFDDDLSGYKDDVHGWNFVDNNNNPLDDSGHGTRVAGVIGAVVNNASGGGGVGLAVNILPLRVLAKSGNGAAGKYSDAVAAMDYIQTLNSVNRRISVANHSWGGNGFSKELLAVINNTTSSGAANDLLPQKLKASFVRGTNQLKVSGDPKEIAKVRSGMIVAATGIPPNPPTVVTIIADGGATLYLSNYTLSIGTSAALIFSNPLRPKSYGVLNVTAAGNGNGVGNGDNDRVPIYPACLASGFIVSVGATDRDDARSNWGGGFQSNYGHYTVDLFAPGTGIFSTKLRVSGDPNMYDTSDGTSFAAPQVAGAAALLRMYRTDLTDIQTRQVLIDEVEPIDPLKDKCLSGGRLNVAKLLDRFYQPILLTSGGDTGGGISDRITAFSAGQGISGRVARADTHIVAIQGGKVYGWGGTSVSKKEVSLPSGDDFSDNFSVATPTNIAVLDNAVLVATGKTATGTDTCYAIKDDGTMWTWSTALVAAYAMENAAMQTALAPVQIQGLWPIAKPVPQAVWMAASETAEHVLVVNADGTVYAFGSNHHGQFGDGTTTDSATPVPVTALSDIVMTAVAADYSLALKADGTVWQFGLPLGASTLPAMTTPTQIASLSNIAFIAVGQDTAYAIDAQGNTFWWFNRPFDTAAYPVHSDTPVSFTEVPQLTMIASGGSSSAGVDLDGHVWTWGADSYGSLGRGAAPAPNPGIVELDAVDEVVAIAASQNGCSVATGGGEIISWGDNQAGQLGSGRLDSSTVPMELMSLAGASFISDGVLPYVQMADGSVRTWAGTNDAPVDFPALGPPLMVREFSNWQPSFAFTMVMKPDKTLWAWGHAGSDKRFGNNTIADGTRIADPKNAVPVKNLGPVLSFTLADSTDTVHCIAVMPDHTVKAWGANDFGQLGNGTTSLSETPVTVTDATLATLTDVLQVAAGEGYSLARKQDGTVWAWGHNDKGQLGIGGGNDQTRATRVHLLTDVIQIDATDNACIAVKADGSVWVWGNGYSAVTAPINYATPNLDLLEPAQVPGISGIKAVHAFTPDPYRTGKSCAHVLALDSDGKIWAWSWQRRVLARTTTVTPPYVPAPVEGLPFVTSINSGPGCAYATARNGSIWAWGSDAVGGLAQGLGEADSPVSVLVLGGNSATVSTLGVVADKNSWLLTNFKSLATDSITSDDAADPDHDDLPNLLEYALGLDPNSPNQPPIIAAVESWNLDINDPGPSGTSSGSNTTIKNYFGLTITRQADIRKDIEYEVQRSTDQTTWIANDSSVVTVLDNATTLKAFSFVELLSDGTPTQYMRLVVRRKGDPSSSGVASRIFSSQAGNAGLPQVHFNLRTSQKDESVGSVAVDVRITPAPTATVTVPYSLSGTATKGSDYTTPPTFLVFNAGETQKSINVTVLQDTKREPTETVIITLGKPSGNAVLGLPATHVLSIQDDEVKPAIVQHPASKLAAVGDTVTLVAKADTLGSPSLQWALNAKPIAGATSAAYTAKNAQFTQAGAYTLTAKNPTGTATSETAQLGIIDGTAHVLNVASGGTATFPLAVAGNGLTFQWQANNLHVQNGTSSSGTIITGATTKTLTLKNVQVADDTTYTCVVMRGSDDITSGDWKLNVLTNPPIITLPVPLPTTVVGNDYTPLQVLTDSASFRTPTSYIATGLPPGLTLNATTGIISGRATTTKTTTYPVLLKATNARGTGMQNTFLTVEALPGNAAGTYTGDVTREPNLNGNLGGRLDFTVQSNGYLSGSIINGTSTYRFVSYLTNTPGGTRPFASISIPRTGTTPLTLSFDIDTTNDEIANASLSDGTNSTVVNGWRNKWSAPPFPAAFTGYYTVSLDVPPALPSLPQGTSFTSLTVASVGTVTATTKLADGVTFASSTFVGPHGQVLVHQMSATADTVAGHVTIAAADHTIGGTLGWTRAAQAATERVYKAGFSNVDLTAIGGLYTAPSGSAVFMGLTDLGGNEAQMSFASADFGTPPIALGTPFRIKSPAVAMLPSLPAARKFTVALTNSTGALTGSITLSDTNPVAPSTKVARTTTYDGIVVRQIDGSLRGVGWFLLADLPTASPATTPTTSPIKSGRVLLAPFP